MSRSGIVRGQKVTQVKVQRSKELRRDQTPQESAVWERVRKNQLSGLHFRRQQVIDGFIADFYCHAARVVIELDGPIHLRQADYDQARDQAIAAHSLLVMRVPNDSVDSNFDQLLLRIAETCLDRIHSVKHLPEAPPSRF